MHCKSNKMRSDKPDTTYFYMRINNKLSISPDSKKLTLGLLPEPDATAYSPWLISDEVHSLRFQMTATTTRTQPRNQRLGFPHPQPFSRTEKGAGDIPLPSEEGC